MIMNVQDIQKILPHRYPFLLVDKILELDFDEHTIVAQKNVTINEDFFNGHFPNQPLMPGVLIIEAMAQATAILGIKLMGGDTHNMEVEGEKIFVLAGIDNVRIKRPVVPGDVLIIKSKIGKTKRGVCLAKAETYVDGQLICSADLIAAYKEM